MVEIFKTDVLQEAHAERLLHALTQAFPNLNMNFDLDDCDKILRVAGQQIEATKIIEVLLTYGYNCSVLET